MNKLRNALLEAVEFIDGVADEGGCDCDYDYLCRSCEAEHLSTKIWRVLNATKEA